MAHRKSPKKSEPKDSIRAKLGYTACQAHLGELIIRLSESHGLREATAWRSIRALIDEVYSGDDLDPGDRDFLLAATMPHKALLRMRIAADGDIYVPVSNPLHHDGRAGVG